MKEYSDKSDKNAKTMIPDDDDLEIILQAINDLKFAESILFKQWLVEAEEHQALYDECLFYREAGLKEEEVSAPDVQTEWAKFSKTLEEGKKKRLRWIWPSIAAAAVIAFAAIYPWMLHWGDQQQLAIMEHEVTLQTEDGDIIQVDKIDKDKAKSMGMTKEQHGSYNALNYQAPAQQSQRSKIYKYTLNIPKGKAYQLLLDDGTQVWVNTNSKITYPSHFGKDKRIVELEGEAYFKVTKDKNRPFIVKTASLTTLVMGTEFNVRAYEKEEANVTLVTGKVSVTGREADDVVILNPGENAMASVFGMMVNEVNIQNYTAWKDGVFYFEEATLEDIMKEISRWYNVKVIFSQPEIRNLRFKFWADRKQTFEEAVSMLNQTGKVSIVMASSDKAVITAK